MRRSLSVLLPVKDAQATLIDSVHEILDVVTDSRDPFEVIIIDDGSTDATCEVAHELDLPLSPGPSGSSPDAAGPGGGHPDGLAAEPRRGGGAARRRGRFLDYRTAFASPTARLQPSGPAQLSHRLKNFPWASSQSNGVRSTCPYLVPCKSPAGSVP